jgi:hypothetical protein
MFVLVVLFMFTVSTRYNINKSQIDLSTYHLNVEFPKSFLLKQKDIIVYNEKENYLEKINIVLASDGKLTQNKQKTFLPNIQVGLNTELIQYFQDLKNINCDKENISSCINKNILKTKGYILEKENKAYLLNKEFGLKIFDIVYTYDKYLKSKKN